MKLCQTVQRRRLVMKDIVKAALVVAKDYPVFPTSDKIPCWSNAQLGCAKGEGGYKVATQDPKQTWGEALCEITNGIVNGKP